MEQLDLCISNYTFNDILTLFKLKIDFDEDGMRMAKRTVLMTHPDKSGLDQKYFLFFSSAYKLLYNVFKVRKTQHGAACVPTRAYTSSDIDDGLDNSDMWRELANRKDFNKVFNEMFEKHVVMHDADEGHGEWLKEEEEVIQAKNRNEMDEMIRDKKASLRSMVVYNGISEMGGDSGTSLTGAGGSNHSSIFSQLQYDDVREAYTNSVVPVTDDDYNSRKQHSSVDSYRRDREQALNDYSTRDHDDKYAKARQAELESDSYRAFSLAKQDEHYREVRKAAAGSLLKLTNSKR